MNLLPVNKYNKRTNLFGSFLFALFLFGCSGSNLTDFEYIQRAKASITNNNPNSAIIELKNALRVNGNNAEARYLLGNLYVELGDAESATKELNRANSLGIPKTETAVPLARALFLLNKNEEIVNEFAEVDNYPKEIRAEIELIKGRALQNLSKKRQAKSLLLSIIKTYPDTIPEIKSRAFLAFFEKDFEKSEEWVNKALAKDPNATDLLLLKGDVLFAQKKYKAASEIFSKLSKLQPYYVLPEILLGISQLNDADTKTAISTFKHVLSKLPNNPLAHYFIATAYLKEKDFEDAKNHSEKAIALDSSDLRSRLIAGISNYMLKNYEQSIDHLNRFLGEVPNHQTALKILAASQTKLGFNDQAIATLNKVTTLTEEDAVLLASIADEAISGGDLRTSKAFFQKASKLAPDQPIMLANLGLAKVSGGEVKEGLKDLEAAAQAKDSPDNIQLSLILTYLKTNKFDKAIKSAQKFQKENPNNPDGYTLQGLAYAGKKQLEKAKTLFEKALSVQPGNANASNNLASYYLTNNNLEKAKAVLVDALNKNPGNPKLSIALSKVYAEDAEFDKAKSVLIDTNKAYPQDVTSSITLASYYLRDNQPDDVLKVLAPVAEKGSAYPSYLEIKGRAELMKEQYKNAIDTFSQLVKLKPKEASFRFYIASAYSGLRDLKSAKNNFRKAIQLNPRNEFYRLAYIRALIGLKETKLAKKQIKKLKPKSQKVADVLLLQGEIALIENNPKKAASFYEQALKQKETNTINILYARSLFAAGKKSKALTTLENWLKKYPEDFTSQQILAELYLQDGQNKPALKNFSAVLKKSPNNFKVLNDTAWLLYQEGKLREAEKLAKQANSIRPNNPVIQDTYGMILLDSGKTKEGLNMLEKASKLAPENPESQYHLALAYYKSGSNNNSKALLEKIISTTKNSKLKSDAESLLNKLGK